MAKKKTPSTKWQDMAKAIASLVEESPLDISEDEHNAVFDAMGRIHTYVLRMESNKRLRRFTKQHPKYYRMLSDLTGHCIKYIEPELMKSIGEKEYLRVQPMSYVHQVCLYDDLMDYRVVLRCRIAKPTHWEGDEVNFAILERFRPRTKGMPMCAYISADSVSYEGYNAVKALKRDLRAVVGFDKNTELRDVLHDMKYSKLDRDITHDSLLPSGSEAIRCFMKDILKTWKEGEAEKVYHKYCTK